MSLRALLIGAAALALLATHPASATPRPGAVHPRHFCAGSIGVPLDLTLASGASSIAPGVTDDVTGTVTAHANLSSVRVQLVTEGDAQLLGASTLDLGPAGKEGTLTFHASVRYGTTGRGALLAHVVAQDLGQQTLERNEGLYAVPSHGAVITAMGDYLLAANKAVSMDRLKGVVDATTLLQEQKALNTLEVSHVMPSGAIAPGPSVPAAAFAALRPAVTAEDATSRVQRSVSSSGQLSVDAATATVTVHGTVLWTDENGNTHPAYGMTVQVRDDELIGSDLVTDGLVDQNGNYSFTVDNDDGPLQGGRDIFVRILTANGAVTLEPMGGGGPYQAESSIHNDVADGADIQEDFVAANTGTGPAAGLCNGATWVATYAAILNGSSFLSQLRLEWPGATGSANYNGSRINLRPGDRWDWDVMFHEYGHYVMDTFDFEDNPGGPHNIGDCISDVHSSKDEGTRMAWGEGWPTFFGTTGQQKLNLAALNVPRVGDVSYTDTGESNFTYSLETNSAPPSSGDSNGLGEDNEIAVQRVMWDLQDTPADSRDKVTVSDQTLFDKVNAADPHTLSQAWAALRSGLSNADDLAYGAITTDHQIGPALTLPANNATVGVASANFSWQKYVGCSSTYDGDNFDLVFYNAATKAKLLTIPGLTTTSASLTAPQVATLIASSHNLLWAVEGRNTASPATGPYLGENRAVTLNRPPVANAGPDQPNVECASHTTTTVQLDGSASSDPDGDPLTYTWSAFGISFSDIHAQKPTGQFPEGSTTVTLTVSDGIQSATDDVTIKVVDTTPPVLTCPTAITVECTSHSGTPATDPAIVAFLAGFTATDVCDATVTVTNDAPAVFPDGTTPVKFTAKDDDLNTSTCTANVNVVDTTPPTLTVSLNRDFLWPPNHKLSDIVANVTVTDICDPNPTFVLTSITSNEPENGLGDGDTAPDVVGASLGTPDTAFQLRSERSGTGSGRRYAVTYTASDKDGNTTTQTLYVIVAHDLAGGATASAGFGPEGSDFLPGADQITLVVPSIDAPAVGGSEGLTQTDGAGTVVGTGGDVTPGALTFDASAIDATRAWLGNSRGVVAPLSSEIGDVNGDGIDDLVLTYSVADVRALRSASVPDDGPIGLHYQIGPMRTWLVDNIFTLGSPVALPSPIVSTSARRATDQAKAGTTPTTSPAEAPAATAAPAPAVAEALPGRTQLASVFPNPFSRSATVAFDIARDERLRLEVYDVRGARVRVLGQGAFAPGRYHLSWDGRDDAGRALPSGLYLIRFEAGSVRTVRKLVLAE
jgi:hypothetical protein